MNDEKQALVPRLRFPKFREVGEWEEKRLGTQGDFLSSLTGKSAKDFDTGDAKFIPYMNVFSNSFTDVRDLRAVNVTEGESQNAVVQGDVFFTVSSETPEEAGMSSVLLEEIKNCYLNSFCALFRFDDHRPPNLVFLGYFLRSELVRGHLSRGAQGATRYNISKAVFRELPLLLPLPPEQQKIADCLSSLDALIAAQSDKLDALKTHKKGLMQQLFPREGETVPRLRFPEFLEAGEWNVATLNDISKIASGGTPNRSKAEYWNGDIPWVSTSLVDFNMIEQANKYITQFGLDNSSAKIFPEGTILMAMYGQGKTRGKVAVLGIDAAINQACAAISVNNGMLSEFVFQNLAGRYEEIRDLSNQGGQENLSAALIKMIPFSYPDVESGEQQKIADCLSSLDALITAQADKLDALKTHKKGLMQQLFPSPEA